MFCMKRETTNHIWEERSSCVLRCQRLINNHIGWNEITVSLPWLFKPAIEPSLQMELIIVLCCSVVFKAFPPVLWSYTRMIHVPFFCFCLMAGLTASSSLRILDKRPDCNQQVRIQSIVVNQHTSNPIEVKWGDFIVLEVSLVFFFFPGS